ncbi:DUF5313 family protein [Hoyosella rhizosphaerae]|uniref:DUF5313 domain-containing protein n=1 Tax=Hoyosella rhizosphaerae TaxID=1755582 RepID=A0A916UG62_9ACTN|nr:DUF5313 family protein [Hoyosella rhizosphaerae]MBN4927960.1 DUF5313 family protein [Hoyosella rhizosphaerae]GGC71282.1 hypothetical protein GCM10011410_25290 [Hoyosella rhizosphaerae]
MKTLHKIKNQRTRPGPLQWIGYSFGRTLPPTMQEWVRNDLTGNRAVPRHLVRSLVPFMPLFALGFLLPGPFVLTGSVVLLGVLLALFYSAAYMEPNRARRLERHGLPADLQNPRTTARIKREKERYEQTHRTQVR